MMICWQQGESATPFVIEAERLAATLEARHGVFAADIAEFFSELHAIKGNVSRAYGWAGVADVIRERTRERTDS